MKRSKIPKHVELIDNVCINIDGGEFARTIFENPDSVSDALLPHNFFLYTRKGSTPESPRLALVVPVVPCDPKHSNCIVRSILRRLGLPLSDKRITDINGGIQ
ncbi:MAG: hypothetical protein ABI162_13005 [Luteolibacter sp.]